MGVDDLIEHMKKQMAGVSEDEDDSDDELEGEEPA